MYAMKIQYLEMVFLYPIKEENVTWYDLDGVESRCGSAIMKLHTKETVFASISILGEIIYGYIQSKGQKNVEKDADVHNNEIFLFVTSSEISQSLDQPTFL